MQGSPEGAPRAGAGLDGTDRTSADSTSADSGTPVLSFERAHALQRRLHELVPGGGHTYSRGEDQFPYNSPQVIARAQGAHCWDVDGNRFIDWAMGNRVYVLGYCYPAVDEAVRRQIALGVNLTRPSLLECELAEYLVDLLPCAEMVKFGKNGSDVTSAAIRLARAYTGRKRVAYCAQHPFFSVHDWFIGTTVMHSGVPREISELTLTFPYNDLGGVEDLLRRHPGEIAALILEPVKNDEPREDFLAALRELTAREGIVLIFDEMISGIRFDIRGAHHRYGVYPDLATYGKAIANGYSFSLLAGKRELMQLGGLHSERPRVFLLSQTHGAELTGLAACRATLEECAMLDATAHIWKIGGTLVRGIRAAASAAGVADHVRAIGFDCNPQLLCTHADGSLWPELHTSFHEELIARGVLMPWTTITYSHGHEEVERTLEAVTLSIAKVARVLDEGTVETSFVGEPVKPVFRMFNRCTQSSHGSRDRSGLQPSTPRPSTPRPSAPQPASRDGVLIDGHPVGDGNPCFIIAEAGSNHDGELAQALRLIEVAAAAGADAVKFQVFRVDRLYPERAGVSGYLGRPQSIREVLAGLELPFDWLPKLARHCAAHGICLLASAFDEESVDAVDEYVGAHKVASYEMTQIPLLRHVAGKGKPVIVSTGAADLGEISETVAELKRPATAGGLVLMQCTAAYPAPLESLNVRAIEILKSEFGAPAGLSDHSRDPVLAPVCAVAVGANAIEKHFTLSNDLPGPDHAFALEPDELKLMVTRVREAELALGSGEKVVHSVEHELRGFARRSLFAARDIEAGATFASGDVTILRNGELEPGLEPARLYELLDGRRARREIAAGSPIRAADLA